MNLKRQFFALYAHSFFSCLRLTGSVWVALLAARGFSLWEIGLAESVYHIVSLTCEVPSGMAADLLGRRRTLILGGVLAVLSNVPMLLPLNLGLVCLGMGLSALSCTMLSGTEEALAYDSLKQAGREDEFLQVNARCSQIQQLAEGLGSLSSLFDGVLGFAGYYLACAAVDGAAVLADLTLQEPIVTEAQAARETQSLRTLPLRFWHLVKDSAACLRRNPQAARLIAACAVVTLPTYLNQMFLQERLVELGWPTAWLFAPALLTAGASIVGAAFGQRLHPARRRRFYALCAVLCGLGTVITGAAPWPVAAIFGDMLVEGVLSVWLLHEQNWLNDAIPSDQRATLLSVDNAAYSLLMIPVSPLAGWLGDATGHTGAGLCALGLCVALSALFALGKRESPARR